jgi:hypothetical protein
MKQKLLCSLLVLTLLMGMVGTSFAASASPAPVLPFGEEVIPLTQEEMEDIEGAWGGHAVAAAVGAVVGGLIYWGDTSPAERSWSGGLKACAMSAMSFFMGSFL